MNSFSKPQEIMKVKSYSEILFRLYFKLFKYFQKVISGQQKRIFKMLLIKYKYRFFKTTWITLNKTSCLYSKLLSTWRIFTCCSCFILMKISMMICLSRLSSLYYCRISDLSEKLIYICKFYFLNKSVDKSFKEHHQLIWFLINFYFKYIMSNYSRILNEFVQKLGCSEGDRFN